MVDIFHDVPGLRIINKWIKYSAAYDIGVAVREKLCHSDTNWSFLWWSAMHRKNDSSYSSGQAEKCQPQKESSDRWNIGVSAAALFPFHHHLEVVAAVFLMRHGFFWPFQSLVGSCYVSACWRIVGLFSSLNLTVGKNEQFNKKSLNCGWKVDFSSISSFASVHEWYVCQQMKCPDVQQ